eukprot:1142152-Amphidinium_carterae.1
MAKPTSRFRCCRTGRFSRSCYVAWGGIKRLATCQVFNLGAEAEFSEVVSCSYHLAQVEFCPGTSCEFIDHCAQLGIVLALAVTIFGCIGRVQQAAERSVQGMSSVPLKLILNVAHGLAAVHVPEAFGAGLAEAEPTAAEAAARGRRCQCIELQEDTVIRKHHVPHQASAVQ